MSIERNTIELTPEGTRADYINEVVWVLFIAQSHIENGVFKSEDFYAELNSVFEGTDRCGFCSFEAIYSDSPDLIEAQPAAFLAATRSIAEEFDTLSRKGCLTEIDIHSFKQRLERLRVYPEAEVSLDEFIEIMAPEVSATIYVNEMSTLYSVGKAMVEQRDKIEKLGLDEHILDFFHGHEGRLMVPFSERFRNEPEVFRTMPSEFVQVFDDLAEELNLHFHEKTLTEDIVVQIFERMEEAKRRLIDRRS